MGTNLCLIRQGISSTIVAANCGKILALGMKANELRLGNWVMIPRTMNDDVVIPSEIEKKVKGIDLFGTIDFTGPHDINDIQRLAKHCSGVPLTEEWLLKFGFTLYSEQQDGSRHFNKGRFSVSVQDDYIGLNGVYYAVRLKYVHQLQNLYFAINGEEL